MSMQTIVLGDQTENLTVGGLIQKASEGSVEVRDAAGNVAAYVLSPRDEEAWAYVEARVYIENHREAFTAALKRRGGVTTAELLARAAAAHEATTP